jgi:two-component system chemotaxis response regulator CheB
MVVYDGHVSVSHGPRENGHRPSVDVLFRSAANVHGARVVGVVLSGALDDGAAGMVAVKLRGGLGLVQDPEQALHASMPRAAAAAAPVDQVLPVEAIAETLSKIALEDTPAGAPESPLMQLEAAMADLDGNALNDPERPGEPAGLSCPDCHGTLFEIHEGGLKRYRCRVGHAWSPESLLAQQTSSFETALWVALRTLEEKAALTLDLSGRAAAAGHKLSSRQFERQSEEARSSADVIRSLIDGLVAARDYPDLQGAADALPAE